MAPSATATTPKPPGHFSKILMWLALVVGVIGLFIEPVGATMWLLVALITRVYRRRRAANYASRVRRGDHSGWRPMQGQQDEDAEGPQE